MNMTKHSREQRGRRLWLYQISEQSDYLFKVGKKEWSDTSLESFRKMIKASAGTTAWYIRHHRKRVDIGDEIVVYSCMTRERPPRLIGFGLVQERAYWDKELNRWKIKIKWDRRTSLALCRFPVDATYLKDRLPQRKSPLVSLSPDLETWSRHAVGRVLRKGRPR